MTKILFNPPTLAQFKKLFWPMPNISILRCLEYERLKQLNLSGDVLDFGGGSKTNYAEYLPNWGNEEIGFKYYSANIDPNTFPTYLVDESGIVPVNDNSFDTVLSMNTFEHVYDMNATIKEISRVLKKKGELIFIVPFIFRVHGHPDDYSRGTPSYWSRFLAENGFADIRIEALTWGPYSTASTISGLPGPFKKLRKFFWLFIDLLLSYKNVKTHQFIYLEQDASICNSPLGYFITARKETYNQ